MPSERRFQDVNGVHIIKNVNSVNILCHTRSMTAKPYHHGDLERALTDAAMHVVRTSGIGALSLRDLARAIGVSPSATYRHFPSRDHLVALVAMLAREELARFMLQARDAVPAKGKAAARSVNRFAAIGRAYVMFAVEHPTLFEAAFTPCPVQPERVEEPRAWDVLIDAIDEMAAAGAIAAAHRKDAPLIAWAGVHGLANILTGAAWPPGVAAGDDIDAVVKGIYRSIS